MRIQMELDRGYLPDAYGKYAAPEDCYDWSCRRSFPFTVEGVPYGTRAYVKGDVEGDIEFPDDLSRNEHSRLVQGYNSAAKSEPERGVGYVGPCPPDRDHKYTLQVIALDDEPLVEAPFWANELLDACRGHAIDEAGRILPSRC